MGLIPSLPSIPNPLGTLAAAAATAVLQRTSIIETNTATGIPVPLVVFDAVLEETPEFVATVTEHPVEAGPEVSDHIQLKNPTLTIRGTISGTPLDLAPAVTNAVAGAIGAVTSSSFRKNILNSGIQQAASIAGAKLLGKASDSLVGQGIGGAADAIARSSLMSAYERRARLDIVTKRFTYKGYVIESMKFPRTPETGGQLEVEIQLKRLRVVNSKTVQTSTLDEAVLNSASSIFNFGSQAPKSMSTAASIGASRAIG